MQKHILNICLVFIFAELLSFTSGSRNESRKLGKMLDRLELDIQYLSGAIQKTGLRAETLSASAKEVVSDMKNSGLKLNVRCPGCADAKIADVNIISPETEARDKLEAERMEKIRNMLLANRPVIIFSGKAYRGEREDFNLNVPRDLEGCYRLKMSNPMSNRSSGSCVRLFSSNDCAGHSIAKYPGSSLNHMDLSQSWVTPIKSIGPCLKNEFEFSNHLFNPSGSITVTKNTSNYLEVPDFIDWTATEREISHVRPLPLKHSIWGFIQQRDKTHYVVADLTRKNLIQSPPQQEITTTAWWEGVDKLEGDGVGFFIPLALDGPPDMQYNAFPQSQQGSVEWAGITDGIWKFLEAGSGSRTVWAHITPVYEESSRPYGFYYRFNFNNTRISYGLVRN